jgi:RND family efflux transporter MFP subunit
MKYFIPLLSLLLIVLLGSIAYFLNSHTADGTAASGLREVPVRVKQARRISFPLTVTTAGELRPVKEAEIVSKFSGKVTELRVKPGDFVTAGSVVAVVRSEDLEQRVARIEASVAKAAQDLRDIKNELAQAEQRLAHNREIFARELIARRDVEQTQTMVETVRAQAELAAAHLAQQRSMLMQVRGLQDLTRLTAPISGTVSRVRIKKGDSVSEAGAVLTLASLNSLKLTVSLNHIGAAGLRPKSKVLISNISNPNSRDLSAEGEIVRIGPDKSGSAETSEIDIHVDNPNKYFRPGMLVEATIDLGMRQSSIWIPRSAVILVDGGSYVFKIANGRAVHQKVVLGPEKGEGIAILEGVQEGELLILELANIGSGTRVKAIVDARVSPGPE